MTKMNLFATFLTSAQPAANFRKENEANRAVLQKLTINNREHTIISSESMRNALRDILAARGLPSNRSRVLDAAQLSVQFAEFFDADKYIDDFIFGYMLADQKKSAKREGPLRLNIAVSTTPYRQDTTFHQSPMLTGGVQTKTSSLLHKEVAYTAYQFPLALCLRDFAAKKEWYKELLTAIGDLSNVAGNHARHYYDMAPLSFIARLTPRLAPGYKTYGFGEDGSFSDLARINSGDLPGKEFIIAGELARKLPSEEKTRLVGEGVRFFDNPQAALEVLSSEGF